MFSHCLIRYTRDYLKDSQTNIAYNVSTVTFERYVYIDIDIPGEKLIFCHPLHLMLLLIETMTRIVFE